MTNHKEASMKKVMLVLSLAIGLVALAVLASNPSICECCGATVGEDDTYCSACHECLFCGWCLMHQCECWDAPLDPGEPVDPQNGAGKCNAHEKAQNQ